MNILEKLEDYCLEHGDKECLFDGTTSLSYAELWDLSGRVYAYVRNRGLDREQTVMISMDRNVYALVCVVGVLRSKAAFLVLGQGYPEERKARIKSDAGCVLEITEDVYGKILATEGIGGYEDRQPQDLAYLVHTSGTTGNPKCIMHEFGGLVKFSAVSRLGDDPVWTRSDRLATLSPINFVGCLYWLFYALYNGATFVLVPKSAIDNLNAYKKFLVDNRISTVFLTPSFLKSLGKMPETVRSAVIFGEAARDIRCDGFCVYNFYSQSELGSLGTCFRIDRPYDLTPIGLPSDSFTAFKVLDENGNLVADGQEGELCMDNPHFRGYRNLPEQTARALAGGIYHTGDIVRKNEAGELVLLHRKDTMLKINGNRVELTEIENRMKAILGGRWTAVNACTNGNVTYLCAYYTEDLPMSIDELKRKMAESLAVYMLPSFYIKLDEIPLNANGKFSRRLLPEPNFGARRKEYKAPVNAMQWKVAAAFEKVLRTERVGIDEDFFELGGDSLSAINVITELDLPNLLTTDVFSLRTVEALSAKCAERDTGAPEEAVSNVLPLAGSQAYLKLFHEKLAPSTAYNLSAFYRLKAGVDLNRLKDCLTELLHAHQVFRTKLRETEGVVEQVLGEEIREPEILELSEEVLKARLGRLVEPYALYDNLLYKFLIFRTEANAYLFVEMHHILTDGTSMQLILKDLQDAYDGVTVREDGYFKLIQGRVKAQESAHYRACREYFRTKRPMPGRVFMPPFDLAGTESVPGICTQHLELSESDLQKVKSRFGLAPMEFFILCYLIALSRLTGKTKVGTAYTVNGRNSALAQNAVGLLLYSYYVNLDIEAADTVEDLARKLRREMEAIRQHAEFDCTTLITDVCDDDNACSNILYQGSLRDMTENVRGLVEEEIKLPDPHYRASYYWEFEIVNCGDGMDLSLYYNASLFAETTVSRMLGAYREVCDEVGQVRRAKLG